MAENETTAPKKRKSAIPTLCEWENLNLEQYALSLIKAKIPSEVDSSELQEKLNKLENEIKQRKRKQTSFIQKGRQSVVFFFNNKRLIPIMKKEMLLRAQARHRKENMVYHDFYNPDLSNHCRSQATAIYTRDDSSCRDCSYSYHYLQVRNNYAETMGRACGVVDRTLSLYYKIMNPQLANDSLSEPVSFPVSRAEPPSVPVKNHWKNYSRPSENNIDELLNNRCDDNVDVDDEREKEEPQKISTSQLKQMEFDFQKQRQ